MKYAGIIRNDVVNGYDVCVSYWCQGCRFRCPGCHNPQTWDFDGGNEIDEDDLLELIDSAIAENGIQRNLSVLGGEPLCEENLEFTTRLISKVKQKYPNILIFIWTGYEFEYLMQEARQNVYLQTVLSNTNVLIDGKFESENRNITLPFRGSSNQRVIDVQSTLNNKTIILYSR